MVNAMLDDLDPDLATAFERARQPLRSDRFMADMLRTIERTQRIRMWRRVIVIAAAVAAVFLEMRPILEGLAAALRFVGDASSAYTELLITPWGWAVSMLVGGWILFRTRPSRG
jgi:hypothetical protein